MKTRALRAFSTLLSVLVLFPMLLCGVSADGGAVGDATLLPCAEQTTVSADAKLLYATVTLADGTRYTTNEIPDVDGASIDATYVRIATESAPEARLCTPMGLRYVTSLALADYEVLATNEAVREIRAGTVIVPLDTAIRMGGVTHALLAAENHIDVPATPGMWYVEDGETVCFAGSIVDIKKENYNLALVGVGYLTVELTDGAVYTVYGATLDDLTASSIATEAQITLRDKTLNKSEKHYMGLFADTLDGDREMLYNRDFKGLNVLAIGDSLFCGAYETVGDKVWVNLLAKTYGWNLTNLGLSGATVSYDPTREASNPSMYGLLMNNAEYGFGSSAYYTAGNPSKDPEDVDLILLEGGVFDYDPTVCAAMGSLRSTNPTTFCGAWQAMTEELLYRYPNATIIFLTAWDNVNLERPDGVQSIAYTSSIEMLYNQVYKNNGRVHLIDAGSSAVSGVNMVNRDGTPNEDFVSQYAYDQYHLNDAGMALMAEKMLPLIAEIVAERCRTPLSEAERMQREMSSLNVLALGDSLFHGAYETVDGDVWINSIAEDCCWNISNLGIGGATVSYDPNRTSSNASMYGLLLNNEEYKFGGTARNDFYHSGSTSKPKEAVDVIFLEAGSNDCGPKVKAPMGTVDSDDPATFLGSWRLMTEELLKQYPNAIVIFITAWEQEDPARTEYTTSVLKLYDEVYADNDRVYLIDAGDPLVSGVDMQSRSFKRQYAYDAFHLNDEGMALMAQNMLPLVWDVIKNQAKLR